MARRTGLGLDRDGVTRNKRIVAQGTEQEIYAALGLPYIAPELRETGKEMQLALKGKLAELVTPSLGDADCGPSRANRSPSQRDRTGFFS